MPFEPDQDACLAVTSSEPAAAGQLDINPRISPTWSSPRFEVVPTGMGNDADRTASSEPDDALALFADEPETSMVLAEEPGTAAVDVVGEPAAPKTAIVLKQLVSRTAEFKKRLEELEESAAKVSGEYRSLEEVWREAAAKLAGDVLKLEDSSREAAARLVGEFRGIEEASRTSAVALAGEYQKVEETLRAAEWRSATAVETLEQIERSLGELTVLHDLARAEARLVALDKRADELDERMARQASDRAETIDLLFRALRVVLLGSAALLAAGAELARQWATFLARQARRTYESFSQRRIPRRVHAARTNLQAGWISLRERWTQSFTKLLNRSSARPMLAHHRAIIVGLGVLALLGFIVSRSVGTTDRIGPSLAASQGPQPPPASSNVPTVTPTVTPEPAPTKTTVVEAPLPKPGARPLRFVGTLAVESSPPGAAVFINRQRVGITPLELHGLQSGSHVVWIERDGYLRWSAAVRVSADKLTRVSATLQPDRTR